MASETNERRMHPSQRQALLSQPRVGQLAATKLPVAETGASLQQPLRNYPAIFGEMDRQFSGNKASAQQNRMKNDSHNTCSQINFWITGRPFIFAAAAA